MIGCHSADDVCHDDQLEIWAGELIEALNHAGHLVEPETYEDKIGLARVLTDEIRKIVRTAFELRKEEPSLEDAMVEFVRSKGHSSPGEVVWSATSGGTVFREDAERAMMRLLATGRLKSNQSADLVVP